MIKMVELRHGLIKRWQLLSDTLIESMEFVKCGM